VTIQRFATSGKRETLDMSFGYSFEFDPTFESEILARRWGGVLPDKAVLGLLGLIAASLV
jgi:hypothetical protein